jgi:SEC-C motif-containing protein
MAKNDKHSDACPCGGKVFQTCCGPFLAGVAIADTPEKLMRSRYTAYVTCTEDYLKATWHPSTRPQETVTDPALTWLGLEVKGATQDGDRGTVHFVARCRSGGRGQRLEETSRFVREDGLWFYVDGDFKKQ